MIGVQYMYCYKCGQELGKNAKFCSNCGLKIVDDEMVNLIVEMQDGKEEAFNLFYEKTIKEVQAVIRTITKGHEQEMEDIAQEVYLTVYQKISTLSNPAGAKAWLRTIARNTAISYIQKTEKIELKKVSIDVTDDEDNFVLELKDTLMLPEDILINRERQEVIYKMLKELPEMQYKVMLSYYFTEKNIAEISKQMNLQVGTVKSYLSKAREKMHQRVLSYQMATGVTLRSFSASPVLYAIFKNYMKDAVMETAKVGLFGKLKEKIAEMFSKEGTKQFAKEVGRKVTEKTIVQTMAVGVTVTTTAVGVTSYIQHDEREIKEIVQSIEQACQQLDEKALDKCLSDDAIKVMKNNSLISEYVNPDVLGYDIDDRTDFTLEVSDIKIEDDEAVAYCIYTETEHEDSELIKKGYLAFVFENNAWKLDFCRMNTELFQTGFNVGDIRFPELLITELIYNDELEK